MFKNIKSFLKKFAQPVLIALGRRPASRIKSIGPPRVLILGGYGFGNTGDEAQLGANLIRWERIFPRARLTVLSPDPAYTISHHHVESELASRVVFFKTDENSHYADSDLYFQITFWPIAFRLMFNGVLMRCGFGAVLATTQESYFLHLLHRSDMLHVSGGGFLTGMTRSRLWETGLVLILCRIMSTPYFLTGQTIGVFKSGADRLIAKWSLAGAISISLRDPGLSAKDVAEIGIDMKNVISSYDDALFCARADDERVDKALAASGFAPGQTLVAVNFHYWGMDAATKVKAAKRMGELVAEVLLDPDVQVILIPMVQSDEKALLEMSAVHGERCKLLKYDYSYDLVRGVLARARYLVTYKHHPIIFAQGEGVPVLSVSLDDYYFRKNQGAMGNFNQEQWCIHGEDYWSDAAIAKLRDFQQKADGIRGYLVQKGEELRQTDGLPIKNAISKLAAFNEA